MLRLRKGEDRGHGDHGWLKSYHSFSFSDYQDPQHMQFQSLRVMNEDWVAPGKGFGTHPHRDMEIVTYVLDGALEHRDSMGNGEVLHPGEFQRMTAGTGITHSEFNPSSTEPVHLYQIWLFPSQQNLTPSYEQKHFEESERLNRLRVVASPDAQDGSLRIHQDAKIYLATIQPGKEVSHSIASSRHVWVQVLRGTVAVQIYGSEDSIHCSAGDGIAISDEEGVRCIAENAAEVMLFDLA